MLRMLSDRIAVIPIEDPDKIGHIIIPQESKRRSDQGIIKYRGSGVEELRVGDHVIFSAYSGDRVQMEGEGELVVMKDSAVIALVTDEASHTLYARKQVEQFLVNALAEAELKTADPIVGVDSRIISECFRAQFDSYETVRVD